MHVRSFFLCLEVRFNKKINKNRLIFLIYALLKKTGQKFKNYTLKYSNLENNKYPQGKFQKPENWKI